MAQGVNSPDGVNMLNANKDVDIRKQPVYESKADLLAALPVSKRAIGLTMDYKENGKWKTGRFENGTADADFVEVKPLRQDLPEDFLVYGYILESKIIYKTDNWRELDLNGFFDDPEFPGITFITHIFRTAKNDLAIVCCLGTGYLVYGITLKNCKIINGTLVPSEIISGQPMEWWEAGETWDAGWYGISHAFHGGYFSNGYIFLSTNTNTVDSQGKYIKLNPYHFEDVKIMYLPAETPYTGISAEITCYKENVYGLIGPNFIKVNESLDSHDLLFSCADTEEAKVTASPFLIYRDEIYIPTVANSIGKGLVGISVYDFKGVKKREVTEIDANPNDVNSSFVVHWATIINDKIILSMNELGGARTGSIARFDIHTLALEEVVATECKGTHRHTVTRDGYIFLAQEDRGQEEPKAKLVKVKYSDFTDLTTEVDTLNSGVGSSGGINPIIAQEAQKYEGGGDYTPGELIDITDNEISVDTVASDARYVKKTGDEITGSVVISGTGGGGATIGDNVALSGSVTGSGSAVFNNPQYLVDGNIETSARADSGNESQSTTGVEDAYFQIDLGGNYNIIESKLFAGLFSELYYKILYSSDGIVWNYAIGDSETFVLSVIGSTGATINNFESPISARYWKIFMNGGTSATKNVVSEWELYEGINGIPSSLTIEELAGTGERLAAYDENGKLIESTKSVLEIKIITVVSGDYTLTVANTSQTTIIHKDTTDTAQEITIPAANAVEIGSTITLVPWSRNKGFSEDYYDLTGNVISHTGTESHTVVKIQSDGINWYQISNY